MSRLRSSGTRTRRITITSYPVGTATVVGYLAMEGSYTTVEHLRIDGSNTLLKSSYASSACPHDVSQPLTIVGHNDVLQYDDYYQSIPSLRSSGIGIGFWGNADNTIIRYSKIHDVGQCQAYDHLIYLSHGNNVQIYGNWLWNDPHGRGVQLYPAPTNARVFNNVIDHTGEGFVIGNEPGDTVSGNQIYNNIITNSTGLPWEHIPGEAIHDLYGGARGKGNTFHNNILFANPGGVGRLTAVRAYKNVSRQPALRRPRPARLSAAAQQPRQHLEPLERDPRAADQGGGRLDPLGSAACRPPATPAPRWSRSWASSRGRRSA